MLKSYLNSNRLEVGIDEAGRGPLFGKVYTAAVILPPSDDFDHSSIKDSKKLTEKKRQELFEYIKNNAIDWYVSYKDETHIDENNILQSNIESMHDCLDNLLVKPDYILVDGNYFKTYQHSDGDFISHETVVKGDDKYTSIAAASILAKVSRDNYIKNLCEKYPKLDEFYSISSNKGYGAKKHLDGIKKYGISPWHRKTFGICRNKNLNKHFSLNVGKIEIN